MGRVEDDAETYRQKRNFEIGIKAYFIGLSYA
jgi:hypothetical protein